MLDRQTGVWYGGGRSEWCSALEDLCLGPAKWLDPAPASYRSFSVTELVVSELAVD